jgi:hypothetical protein
MISVVGNSVSGLGHAKKCDGVKLVDETLTPLLII